MPRRSELRVSALRAAISREMNRIDERQFLDASYCDEIVNTALMEIATGESLRWQGLEADDEEWRLAISDLRVSRRMLNLTTVTAEECNGLNATVRVGTGLCPVRRGGAPPPHTNLFPRVMHL
jgi:hypothetical protein